MVVTSLHPTGLLRCSRLVVGHERVPLLPAVDLHIGSGEFWSILGRNGAGKTTWFKTVLGLMPPVSGQVEQLVPDLRLSYIPQRSTFDELYPVRARDVVRMGLERGWSFAWPPRLREPPEVQRALEELGAAELADRPFRALSEGQKQRVLLARLLAGRANLALLDEPTAAMDVVAERQSFVLLKELQQRYAMTIVVVSHYLGVTKDFADRVVLLDRDSQAVVVGTPEEVFRHPVFRARYGGVPLNNGSEDPADA